MTDESKSLRQFVDEIIEDGVLSREEHDSLMNHVHRDGEIDEEESAQISRIFKLIAEGKLRVVDEERDRIEEKKRGDVERLLKERGLK